MLLKSSRSAPAAVPAGLQGPGLIDFVGGTVVVVAPPGEGNIPIKVMADGIEVLKTEGAAREHALLDTNQIADPGFGQGMARWVVRAKKTHAIKVGSNLAPDWTCTEGATAYIRVPGRDAGDVELVYSCPVHGEQLPAEGDGTWWVASLRLAQHRGEARIKLSALDQAGNVLVAELSSKSAGGGGPNMAGYDLVSVGLQPPSGTRFVTFSIVVKSIEKDTFAFFLQPLLALSNQDSAPPFSAPPFSARVMATLRQAGTGARLATVPLPLSLRDGRSHEVSVFDVRTGEEFRNSPIKTVLSLPKTGELLGLDGANVFGRVRLNGDAEVPLTLLMDGVEVATGTAAGSGDEVEFRVALPSDACDGRPHIFDVLAGSEQVSIGQTAEVSPIASTPFEALQAHAPKPLPVGGATASLHRYQSFRQWHRAAPDGFGAETLIPQLGTLHEALLAGYETRKAFPPFSLPHTDNPRVSIVIPVHGKKALTYVCIAAIAFAYGATSYEVIMVDDGSPDDTATLTEIISNLRIVQNAKAQGFVGACNAGAEAARGDFICFLNNDTEVTAGWLDEVMFAFDTFDGVGLAGSKLIYANGLLQESGGIVWGSCDPANHGRGRNASDPVYNYTRQVDYCSGAAITVRSDVWTEVGGFSSEYAPAYFEDTDLAFKIREAGYKTVVAPRSEVYHFEGMSSGTDVTSATGMKRFQEVNRPTFKRRWRDVVRNNGNPGPDAWRQIDRGVDFRALVVDLETPQPERDAGSYAAIQEMRLLQSLGIKLTFLPLNFAYMGEATHDLQRMGVEALYAPFATSPHDLLAKRGHEFDLIYVTRYRAAKVVIPLIRQHAPQAKIVFCNADLHFLRELRAAIAAGSKEDLARASETRDEELAVMRDADLTLSYNTTEHAVILSHNMADTRVATCPWVVEPVADIPAFGERRDIAFLGNYGHPPNAEAMVCFVRDVIPLLRKSAPGLRLRIWGSRVTPEVEALAADDVLIEGFAPTVADVYNTARVFISPLISGAGLKGKVVEALAYGIPSVLSPVSAEGSDVRSGVDAIVAETPEDTAAAIVKLYEDEAAWTAMSEAARSQAANMYSFERGERLMREALEKVGIFAPKVTHTLVAQRARL